MADRKQAYQLIKLFKSYYKSRYGKDYKGNQHAEKWGFMDMIDDLTFDGAVDVIEYYFKTEPKNGHGAQHLHYHYHEYQQQLEAYEQEERLKRRILRRMKEQHESGD